MAFILIQLAAAAASPHPWHSPCCQWLIVLDAAGGSFIRGPVLGALPPAARQAATSAGALLHAWHSCLPGRRSCRLSPARPGVRTPVHALVRCCRRAVGGTALAVQCLLGCRPPGAGAAAALLAAAMRCALVHVCFRRRHAFARVPAVPTCGQRAARRVALRRLLRARPIGGCSRASLSFFPFSIPQASQPWLWGGRAMPPACVRPPLPPSRAHALGAQAATSRSIPRSGPLPARTRPQIYISHPPFLLRAGACCRRRCRAARSAGRPAAAGGSCPRPQAPACAGSIAQVPVMGGAPPSLRGGEVRRWTHFFASAPRLRFGRGGDGACHSSFFLHRDLPAQRGGGGTNFSGGVRAWLPACGCWRTPGWRPRTKGGVRFSQSLCSGETGRAPSTLCCWTDGRVCRLGDQPVNCSTSQRTPRGAGATPALGWVHHRALGLLGAVTVRVITRTHVGAFGA
jgi:hypothetical protein